MKVVFYWGGPGNMHPQTGNPYARLLIEALAQYGVDLEVPESLNLWRQVWRRDIGGLHFGWVNGHYAGGDHWYTVAAQALSFAVALVLARLRGLRIVWTVHNLYPHEQPYPWVDRVVRLLVCAVAHAVIVHCHRAGELVAEHFGRRDDVYVIPHGQFIDPYPNTISQQEARKALGLSPESFVYVFFGNIRPYKGIETLFDAFTSLDDPSARLVIAGKLHRSYGGTLPGSANQDPRVLLLAKPEGEGIPADEVQVYLNAGDVVVLPFLDTLTSGSAILSLGFGKPVIAPAVGCLPELLQDHGCGIVYQPGNDQALRDALSQARALNLEVAGQRARQRARSLDWDDIARRTMVAYGLDSPLEARSASSNG